MLSYSQNLIKHCFKTLLRMFFQMMTFLMCVLISQWSLFLTAPALFFKIVTLLHLCVHYLCVRTCVCGGYPSGSYRGPWHLQGCWATRTSRLQSRLVKVSQKDHTLLHKQRLASNWEHKWFVFFFVLFFTRTLNSLRARARQCKSHSHSYREYLYGMLWEHGTCR